MIHLLSTRATPQQLEEMREEWDFTIKVAVDVRRRVLAGGGKLHSDCEEILLADSSQQEDVWGADWRPYTREVKFESMINPRPRQNNYSMIVTDPMLRDRIAEIIRAFLEEV